VGGYHIHWYDDTGEPHEPGVIPEHGRCVTFLDEPVAAWSSSSVFSPFARICNTNKKMVSFTIHYLCGLHRNEEGVIQVIPTP